MNFAGLAWVKWQEIVIVGLGIGDGSSSVCSSSHDFDTPSYVVFFTPLAWCYAAGKQLHPEARPVSCVHLLLHQDSRRAARRGRDAAVLRRDAALYPPDDPRPGTAWPNHEDAGQGKIDPAHVATNGVTGL